MPEPILTMGATIMCPHGGQAVLATTNVKVILGGMPALTASDVHMIVGCPFVIVLKPSPCIRIQWMPSPSPLSGPGGVGLLTMASVGLCLSPEQAPQGPALITNPGQTQVMG